MVSSKDIHIIDSYNVTLALALLVEEAVKLRDLGLSAKQITKKIKDIISHIKLIALVNSLKYLKLGGRISAGTAIVGNMLGIRPIVTVTNGKVQMIGKARGKKMAFRFMLNRILKDGINYEYPAYFGHANSPEALTECMNYFAPYFKGIHILTSNIGSVVGTYTGEGAVGLAYIAENKM
jgi:DegV family protein with EDD domain